LDQKKFSELVTKINANLEIIMGNISRAAKKSGRTAGDVQIVAVTKLLPIETIRAGIRAGLHIFGENYPKRAVEKIEALGDENVIKWHMIGPIQSRKAAIVCQYFDMVHSLDRIKIARYLDRYCGELGRQMPVLIEVNLTGEESKSGWAAWDESRWPELVESFRQIGEFPNLAVEGLMSMPPLFEDPEKTRPLYKRLRRLQNFLREEIPELSWNELSIGTSFDYEIAVEEGATMVRIGTALLGPRPA
jgi:pyridoxal phosphate enzyme (YggS family)